MTPYLYLLLAYVLGSTPTSFWVGRYLFGVDLRRVGSGNLGATNTYRALGWKAAIPVALVDVLKGWFPVWFFPQHDHTAVWAWTLGYAGATVVGHVFSFWVRFKGGKVIKMLIQNITNIAVTFTFRMVSLGSLAAALTLPISIFFLPHRGGNALVGFTVALAAFAFWAHRTNIGRIFRGEEHRFGRKKADPTQGDEAAGSAPAQETGEGGEE